MNTPTSQFTIGVDLGGTNTVFGIVDKDGNILCEDSIKTQSYPYIADFIDASIECLKPLIAQAGGIEAISGMGIGAPNGNLNTGCLIAPPNLPWKGSTPLAQLFAERLATTYPTFNHSAFHVRLTNDANAAAMGEMKFGAARGMKDFVLITLGTGVGSGIVANGQMVVGHDGLAGELGHIRVLTPLPPRLCSCGRQGCLETYCSARGIVQTAVDLLASTSQQSLLRNIPGAELSTYEIYKAARQDDEIALRTFAVTGEILGSACADFTTVSSPEAFIFFGGPMKAHEFIMPSIVKSYKENVLNIYTDMPQFLISELMDKNVAVLGAASL
ncbi:MAG: ROK family protein [Bacteroidaceae bacterium]|nr:ROK family protein [Bacteroidaceae bacterium]MBQ8676091.1 ROK family protein [Bacteroidaceae bacterium]MBQ8676098.1 ROK family protein [Bacteroidaceae bacterium]MBR1379578.1 ROK family protein [Bacteroidaceae bacterium]